MNHPQDIQTERRTCANCGNQPDVPVGLVIIVCPICGHSPFGTGASEWLT